MFESINEYEIKAEISDLQTRVFEDENLTFQLSDNSSTDDAELKAIELALDHIEIFSEERSIMKLSDTRMELTPSQLVGRYQRLKNDPVYKDITVSACDNVVSAHKCILSVSSQFFEQLFKQAETRKELMHRSSFELVGLKADEARHLEAIIEFLYSGVIYINDINFMGIMKAASYLAIDELLDLGKMYIEQGVPKENLLKLYMNMKKSLNDERALHSSRVLSVLVNLVWEMVERHFYEHIIDKHEFLEVLPEEVEIFLQKDFKMDKVLNLAVRWMNVWPHGFTFAETLICLAFTKLETTVNFQQTENPTKEIINAIKTIRQQMLSRAIPQSNIENMLRMLNEIQKHFDESCMECDNGMSNENSVQTNINEESEVMGDKTTEVFTDNKKNEEMSESSDQGCGLQGINETMSKGQILLVSNNHNEPNSSVSEKELSSSDTHSNVAKQQKENLKTNDIGVLEKGYNAAIKSIIDESRMSETDERASVTSNINTDGDLYESKNSDDVHKRENCIHAGGDLEKMNNMTVASEKDKMDISMDVLDTIGLQENEKTDGTEEELPQSDNLVEDTLKERVTKCLELMVQTVQLPEKDESKAEESGTQHVKGKKKSRPKRYFNAIQEDKLKLRIKAGRSVTRGQKRRAPVAHSGLSSSEVDEPALKIEKNGDGKESEQNKSDETAICDKNIRNNATELESDHDLNDEVEEVKNDTEVNVLNKGNAMKKRKPRKPGHHECRVCYQVFAQKVSLTLHMNKHMGIKPYKCVVCLQCFTRPDHVVRHMKSQHADKSVFKCSDCNKEFEKPNEMVSHSMVHSSQVNEVDDNGSSCLTESESEYIVLSRQDVGKVQYNCVKCSQSFKKLNQAREHIYVHTGEKPYKCEHCDRKFVKKECLANHVRSFHDPNQEEHKCPKCRRCFIKKDNFDVHVEQCEPRHECQSCPLKFYRKTHLDNHMPVHDLTPQHKCPHCESMYRYRKHLLRHIRKDHSGEREQEPPCICDTCGIVVKNKEALYRHKKTHKLPDKECDVCGKAFKDNTTLKDHKLMHSNIRDYQCEICSMLFARKGNLVRHQKRHRGERKYRCEMCGMCFVANCDLTRHKNTHLGVKKFPCRYCGRKFGLRSKVVVHERTHTGERPYICREENCGKTFKQTGDRVRHEKKVHNLTYNKYMTLYELATGEAEDIYKGADPPKKAIPLPVITNVENIPSNLAVSARAAVSAGANMAGGANMAAVGYSQNPEYVNSYMEEAEMSKIFQRTVAAISQDAITNSGIYN